METKQKMGNQKCVECGEEFNNEVDNECPKCGHGKEQDKIDFGITKENLQHFIENNKVKVGAILEDYKKHLLKSGEYIQRSQAFFIGLFDDMKALVEDEDVDEDEFMTFLDQESHQIEDTLKSAWEDWKEEQ